MMKFISGIFITFFLASLVAVTAKESGTASPQRIIFLGDSLTEGYGLSKEAAYPGVIEKMLAKETEKGDVVIINAGESGSKSSSALSRLKWHLRSRPSILVLALGANDGLRGVKPSLMKENLKQTIELALSKQLKVILLGMKMPFNYGEEFREQYEKAFQDLAAEFKEKIVFVPFFLDGVAGIKKYNLPDGIHPNEEGQKIMAKTVMKVLRPLLTEVSKSPETK